MSIEDLAAQQRRESIERAKRHAKRQDDTVFLGAGGSAVVKGDTIEVASGSNGPFIPGQPAAFLGPGVVDVPSRRQESQIVPFAPRNGIVKVFFSIKRENSNIIEYWLGGDRSQPIKIVEYDETITQVVATNAQVTGTGSNDWIFTVNTGPKNVPNSAYTVSTFAGEQNKEWSATTPKAKYVSWIGLDLWTSDARQAARRLIQDYQIERVSTPASLPTQLVVTETFNRDGVQPITVDEIYYNSVWPLSFSEISRRTLINTYRDPAIESSLIADYVLTEETIDVSENFETSEYVLYGDNNGGYIERSNFWNRTYTQNIASSSEKNRSIHTITIFSSSGGSAELSAYLKYVAPNVTKDSVVSKIQDNTRNYTISSEFPNTPIPSLPPLVDNSDRIDHYFCFNGGYLYTRHKSVPNGTGYRWFFNIGGVETQYIFDSTISFISTSRERRCWTILDGTVVINAAPFVDDGIPAGDSIEFSRHKFVGNSFIEVEGFSEKLFSMDVGQTSKDTLKTISTQCWTDRPTQNLPPP
jgi:hypothetical protein